MILVEGFKRHAHPKIEVHRPAARKPLLFQADPHIVAIASDAPLAGVPLPRLDLGDEGAIADFIVSHCGLEGAARGAA